MSDVGRLTEAQELVEQNRPSKSPRRVPDDVQHDVSGLVAEFALSEIPDLITAFGSGWSPSQVDAVWPRPWPSAVVALLAMVTVSTQATVRSLSNLVPSLLLDEDDVFEYSSMLTLALLGHCNCGHHLDRCRGLCELECCSPKHDVLAWNPATVPSLLAFLAEAIRGLAANGVRGGAFAGSMLYRMLEAEGRLLVRPVEFTVCDSCGDLFEESCVRAGCAASGRHPRRVARNNWFVHPVTSGGSYDEVRRWVCGNDDCGTLYPVAHRGGKDVAVPCPRCGWFAEGRPTRKTVWTKLSGDPVYLQVPS